MYADAHVHWTDLRVLPELQKHWLNDCRSHFISYILEAGVDPTGWIRQHDFQKSMADAADFTVLNTFGLHPYFVSKNTYEVCEESLNLLSHYIPESVGVGETGLDLRAAYLSGEGCIEFAENRQIEFFENQIQLANAFKKPLVLHIVSAHPEAQQILNLWHNSDYSGMVHSFNGSWEIGHNYLKLNLNLSIGTALTYSKNQKLIEVVKKAPLERLLIESDCPDQKPFQWGEELNSSLSVLQVAQAMSEIRNISIEEILQATTENFKRLFRV